MPHKHSTKSDWSKKHSFWQRAQEEKKRVYDSAFHDRELGETVSRVESNLLNVDFGEVLSVRLKYSRDFNDVFRRP